MLYDIFNHNKKDICILKEQLNQLFFVFDNESQCAESCFEHLWLSLYGQKQVMF